MNAMNANGYIQVVLVFVGEKKCSRKTKETPISKIVPALNNSSLINKGCLCDVVSSTIPVSELFRLIYTSKPQALYAFRTIVD